MNQTFVLRSIDPRLDVLVTFWSNTCTPEACGATPVKGENANAAKFIKESPWLAAVY